MAKKKVKAKKTTKTASKKSSPKKVKKASVKKTPKTTKAKASVGKVAKKKIAKKPVKKVVKKVAKKTATKTTKAAPKTTKKQVKKAAAPKAKVASKASVSPAISLPPVAKSKPAVLDLQGFVTPLDDRLIVQVSGAERMTAGGLFIPDTVADVSGNLQGVVLAVGRGHVNKKGHLKPMDVQVGDNIVFAEYAGSKIKLQNEDLIILREGEVMGVVSK